MNSFCHVSFKYRAIKHSIVEAIKFIEEKQITIKGNTFFSASLGNSFWDWKGPYNAFKKGSAFLSKKCLSLNVA